MLGLQLRARPCALVLMVQVWSSLMRGLSSLLSSFLLSFFPYLLSTCRCQALGTQG